ncbi:MAG: ankyrin repeat domain-containing protein [Acidobacteria bacterium]|nr:ankyrin repeat domain-containing protein [Acidobacteriota bacterium]
MQATATILNAIRDGDAAAVRAAVEKDPSIASAHDEKGLSVVMQAAHHRQSEILSVLLAAGPALDLFEAAALGKRGLVADLVDENPAAVAALSPDGFSPLHLACFFGHSLCAELLIQRAADVNAVAANPMAVAPLHSAAAGRHLDIVKLLLEKGADANAQQHGGWTALHSAARNGDGPLVDALVEAGADSAIKSSDGKTAADMAEQKGHSELAERLA